MNKHKMPAEVARFCDQQCLKKDEFLFWMVCDRDLGDGFINSYLLLSMEHLIILRSDRSKPIRQKVFKGYIGETSATASVVPENWTAERIGLGSIESLSVVNLVASGIVVLKTNGQESIIGAFTNEHTGRASKLASLFGKLKNKDTIGPDELEEGQTNAECPKCGMIYPEEDRTGCPRCMNKSAIFARLLTFVGPYKGSMFLIVLFTLFNSATGLAIPYFQGTILFDQALGGTGPFAGRIGLVVLIIVLFRTGSLLFGVLFGVLNSKMSTNIAFDLKASVFNSMQRLSLGFYQKKQTGQLMTRVNNDATDVQFFFVDGVPYFVVNAMNIIGIVTMLLILDWQLTLICLIPVPFVIWLIRKTFPKLWKLSWVRYRRISGLNSIISDMMKGTRVIKAFGKENREMQRFDKANIAYSDADRSYNQLGASLFPTLALITQVGGLLIWAFGGWMVMGGSLTFGVMMTFIQYMLMLYGPIDFMNRIVGWWSNTMASAQRIFEIQDTIPEVAEKKGAIHLNRVEGEISVSGVTFGYEPNKLVLRDVSLHVKPGQMIGIVGPSGAGKSTLVNLITRLHDVNEGEIRIDGYNIRDLTFDTLRSQIGFVSQEVYVFMGTIAENIAYAKPDCSVEQIIRAAKIANAHDFIERLPDGYDTIVGMGGHELSGGEKQRISIARAILHDPKIIILDEATASLDTETELQIQEALESLVKGKTAIAIAHRLSTLRRADYLIVMEGGKVTEAGTHDELMSREGVYFEMVKKHDEALKLREAI